jgi:hypothetical protein
MVKLALVAFCILKFFGSMGLEGLGSNIREGCGKVILYHPTYLSWQLTCSSMFSRVPPTEACFPRSEIELHRSDFLLSPLRDRTAQIRLSLYADDAGVFINPIKQEVDLIIDIMRHFSDATSLRINVNKSTVAPIRCSQLNLDEVLQNFSGARVTYPITYLGLLVTLGRLKLVHL